MTREEAIQICMEIKHYLTQGNPIWDKDKVGEALEMAIEALKRERPDEWCTDCKEYDMEKKCCPRFNRVIRGAMEREPGEDLISRQAAIDALYDKGSSMTAWGELLAMKWSDIQKCIEQLPSAEARPTGEWIPLVMNGEYKCSVCGRASKSDNAAWVNIPSAYWNYCPNCGADMRGDTK